MAGAATIQERELILTPEAIKAIERILASGRDAKVSTGKSGVTVYEERVKKAYAQS